MDYKLINKIIDDVYGEFGSNYENALRDLFYQYDKQKEIIKNAKNYIEKHCTCLNDDCGYEVLLENEVGELLEILEEIE